MTPRRDAYKQPEKEKAGRTSGPAFSAITRQGH
jgi:hypothetical protein